MKILLGTANLNQRPSASKLRSAGARLTQVLARKSVPTQSSGQPEPPEPIRFLKTPRPPSRSALRGRPRPKPSSNPRHDPLAWAKAAAAMRQWKELR